MQVCHYVHLSQDELLKAIDAYVKEKFGTHTGLKATACLVRVTTCEFTDDDGTEPTRFPTQFTVQVAVARTAPEIGDAVVLEPDQSLPIGYHVWHEKDYVGRTVHYDGDEAVMLIDLGGREHRWNRRNSSRMFRYRPVSREEA